MRRIAIAALGLALALALGCGWPRTDRERAEWFFDKGQDWILDALDDAGADGAQRDAAREVLAAREAEVTAGVEAFFGSHRDLLRTLAGGAAAEPLLAQETELSETHREALRRIGAMHEAVGDAVGEPTWSEARALMAERIDERMDEE
jgi:hypothetical protein